MEDVEYIGNDWGYSIRLPHTDSVNAEKIKKAEVKGMHTPSLDSI